MKRLLFHLTIDFTELPAGMGLHPATGQALLSAATGLAAEADEALLERVVETALAIQHVELPVELDLLLTGDSSIQELNRTYRGFDQPTDVLSFPLLPAPLVDLPENERWASLSSRGPAFVTPPGQPLHLGGIAIALPQVDRQAVQAGHSPTWELCFLLVHGLLHLLGYDDQSQSGYEAMVASQERVLQVLNIPQRADKLEKRRDDQ